MHPWLRDVFEHKNWSTGPGIPRSGEGSSTAWTEGVREALPSLFSKYGVKTFLDAPCGDWFWMQHVDLSQVSYIGADISGDLIENHQATHARPGVTFQHLDITSDPLPEADMMMCRDCLFHLKETLRWDFFRNFAASGIEYLLTTINHVPENPRLRWNGNWKPFNPMLPPFSLPAPLQMIHEYPRDLPDDWQEILAQIRKEKVDVAARSMGVWHRDQILDTLKAAQEQAPHAT